MSKEMKYVIYDECFPILFSLATRHGTFRYLHPNSAAECRIRHENGKFTVDCYGESVDLHLKAQENDHRIIEFMLNDY